MSLSRSVARPLLAAGLVYGGLTGFRNADALAAKAAPVTDKITAEADKVGVPLPHDTKTLVRLNAGVQIGAGSLLAFGIAPRISAAVLAGSLAPTTIAGHAFWKQTDPAKRKTETLQFCKNLSMLGGLLIAANDTDLKPGLAWRARRATQDARREARHLAASARREARLASARLS